jgi:hypothetical protein
MILGVAVDEGHDVLLGVLHQTQLMACWQPLLLRVKRPLSRLWRSRAAVAQHHDSSIHSREPHGCSRDIIN